MSPYTIWNLNIIVNIIASLTSLNSQVLRFYAILPFHACLSALFSFDLASALCIVTAHSCITRLGNTSEIVRMEWESGILCHTYQSTDY
jgi:hypothetical protein